MTQLYSKHIYGPVRSRRLGISLGVNLLPTTAKVCSFDCIYCECGSNEERRGGILGDVRNQIKAELEQALPRLKNEFGGLDSITFAGNGEPTIHPQFSEVVEDIIKWRNANFPSAKISVLSNACHLDRADVCEALKRVDNAILKLDSAFDSTAKLINRPTNPNYHTAKIVEQMATFGGKMVLQTMFLRGNVGENIIDNTTEKEVSGWIDVVRKIAPEEVMIYTIARDTPIHTLQKVSHEDLENIAEQLRIYGIKVVVSD